MPILLLLLTSFAPKERADLIVYNAKIYTLSKNMAVVEAMAVKEGRVLAFGEAGAVMTPDNLRAVFEIEVDVTRDAGSLRVICTPRRLARERLRT